MQTLPKPSLSQITGFLVVAALGTIALVGLPVGAQEETEPSKTEPMPAEAAAQTEGKESTEKPIAPAGDVPSAEKLFEQAREKLRTRMYSAKIVQRLSFPNRSLEAKGRIVRGQKFRMRLEFEIKSGATTGRLLQVCNGDKLWTERHVNDITRLTQQDVSEILSKTGADPEKTAMVVAEMGLGGVTSLLASLERNMKFTNPQTVDVDGETLYRVDGQWNAEFMKQVKANPQLAKGLSEYIPDGSRVYFDRDDFPRRIQYLKKVEKTENMRPTVTLDFLDVVWLTEADMNPKEFEYQAPERVFPEDVTKFYVDQLQPPKTAAP